MPRCAVKRRVRIGLGSLTYRIPRMQVEELHMFREMVAGFEEERTASESRIHDLGMLLHQAVADIQALQVCGGGVPVACSPYV